MSSPGHWYTLGLQLGLLKQAESDAGGDPFGADIRKHFQIYLGQQPEQMEIEQQVGLMLLGRRRRRDQMAGMLRSLYAPMAPAGGK